MKVNWRKASNSGYRTRNAVKEKLSAIGVVASRNAGEHCLYWSGGKALDILMNKGIPETRKALDFLEHTALPRAQEFIETRFNHHRRNVFCVLCSDGYPQESGCYCWS